MYFFFFLKMGHSAGTRPKEKKQKKANGKETKKKKRCMGHNAHQSCSS